MNGIATPTARKIEEVIEIIANHYPANTKANDFGGVDLWMPEHAGYVTRNGISYFAEGVRVATDDTEIYVIRFAGNQVMTSKVTLSGDISADLLVHAIKELF